MQKRPDRQWDWLLAILLFLLMQVSAARLVTTNWAPSLYFAESLAALGTMLGLALGVSRFGRRAVWWLVLVYTVVVVPWQISSASDEKHLLDRLRDVGSTLLVALGQFMRREPVRASLFFVTFAALVFWLLCIAAGYWAARHRNILAGIIPSGIIVLVIQVYANYQLHGSWWLGVYLLVALLLVGRAYYLQNERVWLQRRVYIHDEAWQNILGGLFMLVFAAITVAWAFPTSISSVQAATDAWTSVTHGIRDRLSNAVTSLNGPYGRPGTNFYGTSLGLGQVAAQGDAPVFTVQVLDSPTSNLRYYWRARVYDTYSNGDWSVSPSSSVDFIPASNDLDIPDLQFRSEARLRFTLQFPTQNLIYAPSEPVWLDQAATVQVTPVDTGVYDILSWQAKRNITNGNRYEVRAQMADPDVQQLQAASTTYRDWIKNRYLAVPSGLQREFQVLARQVTAGMDNPYDKAAAITGYLRTHIQYATSIPAAPEGRDPVEWVLFSYKKGFCNYYASAEVLMLRSVGVPARLAVGFAEGEFQNGSYTVRRRDAHAWPEVFFPGLGWVEFEPTVSQSPLVRANAAVQNNPGGARGPIARPLEDGNTAAPKPGTPGAAKPAVPFGRTPAGRALIAAAYLAGIAVIAFLFYRYRLLSYVPIALNRAFEATGLSTPAWLVQWLRWNRLEAVEQAFAPVTWSLRWLGKPPPVHATPTERAATLKQLMPLAVPEIETVATQLEIGLFTPQPADVPTARRAGLVVLLHALRTRVARFLGM